MCGILGFYSFDGKFPDGNILEAMFVDLDSRGGDASGIAYELGGKIIIGKQPVKAKKLVKTNIWKRFVKAEPHVAIMHTRFGTQGSKSNNMNNHPLFSKNGWAIVHNGIINNDREVFASSEVKRDAEVDSEAILAMISSAGPNEDPVKRVFENCSGSYAVAAINNRDHKLYLFRNTSPIELLYDTNKDIIYFCSEIGILEDAIKPELEYKRGFCLGKKDYIHLTFKDNYQLVIDAHGVEKYQRENPKKGFFDYDSWKDYKRTQKGYGYEEVYRKYQDKKRGYEKSRDLIYCPDCSCEMVVEELEQNDGFCLYCNKELVY